VELRSKRPCEFVRGRTHHKRGRCGAKRRLLSPLPTQSPEHTAAGNWLGPFRRCPHATKSIITLCELLQMIKRILGQASKISSSLGNGSSSGILGFLTALFRTSPMLACTKRRRTSRRRIWCAVAKGPRPAQLCEETAQFELLFIGLTCRWTSRLQSSKRKSCLTRSSRHWASRRE
jgi:hypothetical protein